MSRQRSRVTGAVGMAVLAVVTMTAAFADTNQTHHSAAAEFRAALPSPTPPASKEANNVVGTCNTARGCAALKDACKSLKKHSFKTTDTDGNLGVCIDQSAAQPNFYLRNSNDPGILKQPNKKPAADVGLAAPKNTTQATLYCNSVALCTKVKNACKVLKGDYTPSSGHSGSCSY